MGKPNGRLNVAVQYASRAPWVPERNQLRVWLRAAVEGGGQITVRFIDEDEGRTLNRDYRGKDYATNVLSFPYDQTPVVGDLAICPAVAAREAAEQGKTPEAHFAHLVVHGALHLQGYDHEGDEEEAEAMEAREREVLAALGYPDPYAGER